MRSFNVASKNILTDNLLFIVVTFDILFGFLSISQISWIDSPYDNVVNILSLLLLLISGFLLVWERSKPKITCTPLIIMQEYADYYAITPKAKALDTDIEGDLIISISQKLPRIPKLIKKIEIEIPSLLQLRPMMIQNNFLNLEPEIMNENGVSKYIFSSNRCMNDSIYEYKFGIRADLNPPLGRNKEKCKVIIHYLFLNYLGSSVVEEFEIIC
ncbi:MAG: hypothetical protein AB7V56_06865 [Candidatus Nitrosocosmicus sp.]